MMNLALLLVAAGTVVGWFARLAWVAELATHFRLQYFVALIFLAVGYLVARRRVLACVASAFLLANAWYVVPYLLPDIVKPSVASASGRDVTVVSLNLLMRNGHHDEVRDYLRRADADVLVLSEFTPAWASALKEVTAGYPYALAVPQTGAWGLGVFSRYPLASAATTDLGVAGNVNVAATLELPGGDVQLIGVHLVSPTRPSHAAMRNRQLVELTSRLGPPRAPGDPVRLPRLLVGDMNITPYSPYFGDLLVGTGMTDTRLSAGLLGTWPTWAMPLHIPIDHCLVDADLPVVRLVTGPIVGSDHYPLEITLRPRG